MSREPEEKRPTDRGSARGGLDRGYVTGFLIAVVFVAAVVLRLIGPGNESIDRDGADLPTGKVSTTPTPILMPEAAQSPVAPSRGKVAVQQWFFVGDEMTYFYEEVPKKGKIARTALERLLKGPSGPLAKAGVKTRIPKATELTSLWILGDHADIRLDGDSLPRSAKRGRGALAQLVYTVTQFPSINYADVYWKVRGRLRHVTMDPRSRIEFRAFRDPLIVESPHSGQTVDSTFDLLGVASLYEGPVSWRLIGSDGAIIDQGLVREPRFGKLHGKFQEKISIERLPKRDAVLQVSQSSQESGVKLHTVEIPLKFSCAGPQESHCGGGGGGSS